MELYRKVLRVWLNARSERAAARHGGSSCQDNARLSFLVQRPVERRSQDAASPVYFRYPSIIGSGTAPRSAPQRNRSVHPDPKYRFCNVAAVGHSATATTACGRG